VGEAAAVERRLPQRLPGVRALGLGEPQLEEGIRLTGGRHLREELGGRDRLRGDAGGLGHLALGHPERGVDQPRGVALHGHGIGVGQVDPVEVQDLLEIEVHPLDGPPPWVEGQGLLGRQARPIADAGQEFVDNPAAPPADVAEYLDRSGPARARLDEPVGEPPALVQAGAEPSDLPEAQPPVAPDEAPAPLRPQGGEPGGRAGEAIGHHEGVRRQGGQDRRGARQLARRRVGTEVEDPAQPPPEVVGRQEAAGQDHGPLVPEELQAMGDGGHPGAVQHQEVGEAGAERGERGRIAGGSRREQRRREPPEHLREEGRAEVPAPLEEGLGGGLDLGEQGLPPFQGLVQGLA